MQHVLPPEFTLLCSPRSHCYNVVGSTLCGSADFKHSSISCLGNEWAVTWHRSTSRRSLNFFATVKFGPNTLGLVTDLKGKHGGEALVNNWWPCWWWQLFVIGENLWHGCRPCWTTVIGQKLCWLGYRYQVHTDIHLFIVFYVLIHRE